MVVAAKLKSFLDESKVRYHVLKHHEKFTSPEIAQALHVPGQLLAKVVMLKAKDELLMAVLPANLRVDLDKFAKVADVKACALATEDQFRDSFPDCEVGAMPPFGNLYGIPVYVDRSLTKDDEIVFEAGNHHEAIKLDYLDFERTVKPKIGDFGGS
jgi:Ala-tRNA(Pro) deacylase